jgi:hypothetical protein
LLLVPAVRVMGQKGLREGFGGGRIWWTGAAPRRKRRKAGPFFNGPAFLSLWGQITARTS